MGRAVAVVLGLLVATGAFGGDLAAFLKSVDRIELIREPFDEKSKELKVIVSDAKAVQEILSLVACVKKGPCRCAHTQSIVFHSGDRKVTASICEHCFDVSEEGKTEYYEMPERLYKRVQDLLDAARP